MAEDHPHTTRHNSFLLWPQHQLVIVALDQGRHNGLIQCNKKKDTKRKTQLIERRIRDPQIGGLKPWKTRKNL